MPGLIDTHVHFYDPTRPQGVPWPKPDNELLYRTVLPADYRRSCGSLGFDAVVVVEASPWVEDNQWILDLAAGEPSILGFVGNLDPKDPEFPRHLERFASDPVFRGIRIGKVTPQNLESEQFMTSMRLLSERSLSLDLLAGPADLPAVAALVEALPDLTVVLDHCTHVPIDGSAPAAGWVRDIGVLRPYERVFCKISWLTESAKHASGARGKPTVPREVGFYRPVLDALVEAFGTERLLYATNWPVVEMASDTSVLTGILNGYLEGLGGEAADSIRSGNAVSAYRLKTRPVSRRS